MMSLIWKTVRITELCYVSPESQPFEIRYRGRVAGVDGHMVKVIDCRITDQPHTCSFPDPETRWFNTLAKTFKSIDEE